MHKTKPSTPESAIIVGVITPDESRWEVRDHLNELEQLASTAGAEVTERVTQSLTSINPATFIGGGKVEELRELTEKYDTDLVIFDDDLAPVQVRNLERRLNCKLLDRSGLILDIFATRAQTAAAKTQVELAQLDYLRTRLTRRWTHLSRQKGGIGTKGPGETQIETDRRLIGTRMAKLREKLEQIDRQRTTQRKRRSRYTCASLVGYTNAGKSTLMNALAGTELQAEDRLFATLDATTRNVQLDTNKEVLFSDTVGFIRKLPHRLIESFKSTLDEVRESDVLVHVVDVTHPSFRDHMGVVHETLKELGADQKPTLLVFNKIDGLKDRHLLRALRREFPAAAFVSALRGIGLEGLKEKLLAVIEKDYVTRVAYIPVSKPKAIAYIHRVADVVSEEYMYASGGDGAPPSDVLDSDVLDSDVLDSDVLDSDVRDDGPQAVARMQFRVSKKHAERLERMLAPFAEYRPVIDRSSNGADDKQRNGQLVAEPKPAVSVRRKAAS